MSIIIKEVISKSGRKKFVNLPFEIYKGNEYWVPPIKKQEMKIFSPETNPTYDFCKAKFWIATKDDKCVGRLGAIINDKYIEKTGEKFGRFTRPEFIDDYEVSSKLFQEAEKWLKEQGMIGVQGPLGFTNLDLQGLLIEGFDHLPSMASVYHLPYYKTHIEKSGYDKEIDWVEFRLSIGGPIPEKITRINELIKKRYKLNVVTFKKTSELLPYGRRIFGVLNEAFAELFSVVTFDEKMIDYYVNKYLKYINPNFVKLIINDEDQMVGFIIGQPCLAKAMQKANGKLFPFGFKHIKYALNHPKVADLLLTGVNPNIQGKGFTAILIAELQKTLNEYGIKHVETTGIFETNHKAIQMWKNYDHIQHKRKRCFKKIF